MFCNKCAAKCVTDSQLDVINQAWIPAPVFAINPKIQVKPKLFTWNEETCPHQKHD